MAQVSLTTWGGLVASMPPEALPEGASPRCSDVDFTTGGWRQRSGLQNAFTYSGESEGPNPAFSAVDTVNNGAVWANPGNILLNDGSYAVAVVPALESFEISSVKAVVGGLFTTAITVTFTETLPAFDPSQQYSFSGLTTYTYLNGRILTPGSVTGNQVTFSIFGAPTQANTADTGSATVSTAPGFSDYLDVTNFTFAVSGTVSTTGIKVGIKGMSSAAQTCNVALLYGGVQLDPPKTFTLPASSAFTYLGGINDQWMASLSPAIINSTTFGIRIWITGTGTASLDYATIQVYTTPANVNFNYCGKILAPSGVTYNLALDASGNWWLENPDVAQGELTLILSGTVSASMGRAIEVYDRAYTAQWSVQNGIVTGADIPRQYNLENDWWDRVTQCGPGAAPTVSATSASTAGACSVTAYSATSGILTLTISALSSAYPVGELISFTGFSGACAPLNGLTFSVLGSPAPTTTSFAIATTLVTGSGSDTGTGTPQYSYPISTITQPAAYSDPGDAGHLSVMLWSSGPGSTSAGNTVTVYYQSSWNYPTPDQTLVNAFNAGYPVYVYISNAPFANGIWQVTSIGNALPPKVDHWRYYFTISVPTSSYQVVVEPQGQYQITQGTITLTSPVPGLIPGAQIAIAGASVSAWDTTYNIVESLNSGAFNITQTSLSGGTATYSWTLVSGSAPAAGQLVTVTNTLNGNGVMNVSDALIASASGGSSGTFTVDGFAQSLNYGSAVEQAQATTAGTQFVIDPGAADVGSTSTDPILGNSTGGTLTIVGSASAGTFPIGAGIRQICQFFVTRNGGGYVPSPPVTISIPTGSNYLQVGLLIGPPNVVARGIIVTEAGQQGLPGNNFYFSGVPTEFTVNNVQFTSNAFLVPDNITTVAKFTFSDSVLLASQEVDIPGSNWFNLIEIGNPAWMLKSSDQVYYGACQNKVQNFNNMSFDGGYWQPTQSASAVPSGWTIDPTYSPPNGTSFTITAFAITSNIVTFTCTNTLTAGLSVQVDGLSTGTYLNGAFLTVLTASSSQFTAAFTHADVTTTSDSGTAASICNIVSLRPSPIFGNSLYVQNQTASTQSILGMITQSAYQDAWSEPILNPNGVPIAYSVRVVCRCPSGITTGNLVIDLVSANQGQYGQSYGSLTIPFSSLTTQFQTITGTITPSTGLPTIPTGLVIRVYGTNMVALADYEIDRIEVFPTNEPVLTNTVYVSYPSLPEQVDGVDGQLTLNSQSQDPAYGATVVHNQIVFKKGHSIVECEPIANYQPARWQTREVSLRGSGACGPNAFAQGDEWDIGLTETGFYVYSGGAPMPMSVELQGYPNLASLWDQVNWAAKQTFWLDVNLKNHRIRAGVAMKTPNFWLPYAPANSNPTTPNVVLMCNFEGVPTAGELENAAPAHVTMFGTLKALDMRRKWSIDLMPSPYGGQAYDSLYSVDGTFICNGIDTSKIYRLVDCSLQSTDDGVPIAPVYTTAGIPEDTRAQQLQLGSGRKYAMKWMAQIIGSTSGQLAVKHYQNVLNDQYPVTVPFLPPLSPTQQHNIEWRAEVQGQKIFTEFSLNKTGTATAAWLAATFLMTEMVPHPWGTWRNVSS